jgi:hypothetical protein
MRLQQDGHEKLGALLVTLGICAQRDVAEALAVQLGCRWSARYPGFPILRSGSRRFLREATRCPCARTSTSSRSRWPIDRRVHHRRVPDGDRPRIRPAVASRASSRRRWSAWRAGKRRWARSSATSKRGDDRVDADIQQLKDLASKRR